jgi:hypothetical protein
MTNKEKSGQISQHHKNFYYLESGTPTTSALECYHSAMEMAEWKDEQIAFALSFLKPRLSANEYAIVCERLNFKK